MLQLGCRTVLRAATHVCSRMGARAQDTMNVSRLHAKILFNFQVCEWCRGVAGEGVAAHGGCGRAWG